MKEVSIGTYFEDLRMFAHRNNTKSKCVGVFTSEIENNSYHKEIVWENGATWYEKVDLVVEKVPCEVHGYKLDREMKFNRIEYWSTDMQSKIAYELIR